MEIVDLETLLVEAALAGGSAIMPFYAEPIHARVKADASPVTAADEAAEKAVLAVLTRRRSDVPIVAEEAVSRGDVPDTGERFFLVDPLDGTKEFIAGNGEFTVNVALVENGVPTAGVVYAPAVGRLFLGAANAAREGKVQNGRVVAWRPIAARTPPPGRVVAVASRSHGSPETEDFLLKAAVTQRVFIGSSLKFCLIAAGEADIYPRLGPTMQWDTAAGHAVLSAAGGRVERFGGGPLFYSRHLDGSGEPFLNPWFVAHGASPAASR